MECNRDEALKAKAIAESKLEDDDIAGARKFALKAQSLFPKLEGIDQMIMILDIHLASQSKDMYAILGLYDSADEETMKKQYKKLALQFHPDKNKSAGAADAFKLIAEAWSTLSDKTKRMEYDQKLKSERYQKMARQPDKDNSFSDNANVFYDFVGPVASKPRPPMPENTIPSADKFWTSCEHCRMQYEYRRVFIHHYLLCPNCRQPFFAKDTGGPVKGTRAVHPWPTSQRFSGHSSSTGRSTYPRSNVMFPDMGVPNFQRGDNVGPFVNQNFHSNTFSSATDPIPGGVQAANMVHETYQNARRAHEAAVATDEREDVINHTTNVLTGKFSVPGGSSTAESSESLLRRKRTASDEDTSFFFGQAEASVMRKRRQVFDYSSDFGLSAGENNLGMGVHNRNMKKTALATDSNLEVRNSAAGAKFDEKKI